MDTHGCFLTVCEKIVEKTVYFIAKKLLTGIAERKSAAPAQKIFLAGAADKIY